MIRRPLLCSQPALGETSIPMSTSCLTARGVRPSPQTFSLGKADFSSSSTSSPALARWYAVVDPAGPAPTTITSALPSTGLVAASSAAAVSVTVGTPGCSDDAVAGHEQSMGPP